MRKRVLVFIDQASRDGISQLLIVAYLRRKGVKVYVSNQHTFIAMFERCRPHVAYVSWLTGGPNMEFLLRNHHRSRIALIDQEGGRMGEVPFRRHFTILNNGIKEKVGRIASTIFVWGSAPARWLLDMGIVRNETISVVGSPRFDPYLVYEPTSGPKYLGVTLRGDPITSVTVELMRSIYHFAERNALRGGIGIGYPIEAQFEDKMWHVVASTRHLFKTASAFSRRSAAPIVFRPGPWEQPRQYDFIPATLPTASVVPYAAQHDYVRNAFALLEESSSMGLDGLLAGVPVVSVQGLIPRLSDHIAGGGLYEAPYGRTYWRPTTVDEAVDLLMRAELGKLAPSPRPDELEQHLLDYHFWPRRRPSSFQIGDAILKLLDMPDAGDGAPSPRKLEDDAPMVSDFSVAAVTDGKITDVAGAAHVRGKEKVFRHLPGAVGLLTAKCFVGDLISPNRQVWFRYHYYPWVYRHHDRVRTLFESLWQRYEVTATASHSVPSSAPPRETTDTRT